ncbi:MAG TPA: transcriptional repressor [Stackebrandtia sp.]|jgi:Fur family ferric uptake transcriptional regulator|uniref:Fur family transcriptional regulator n=1 Tax=Stackebrandtia sp. TaxID=2023065 RepID=UPI002D5AC0AC|nr:transcriptional repressor [Stackebrandtia sp.]HZE41367.1 transcriptional repressor [Stackebrandtia sp.]
MNDTRTMPRSTKQRTAVMELLADIDGFHSAQELHTMLRDREAKIGLTTVYRTLQALADGDEVDVMRMPSGEHLYRRCSSGHHHHLVCQKCGRTVEVAGPDVERWAETVAAEHGFTNVTHTVEIFGRCAECGARTT